MPEKDDACQDTLFLFVDESGNFDFSSKGSKNFVLAGIATLHPLKSASKISELRYELLTQGHNISHFHATEDLQEIRDAMFEVLTEVKDLKCHVISGSKSLVPTNLRSDAEMHASFAKELIKFTRRSYSDWRFQRVVVVFDQSLTKARQKVFHKAIKREMRKQQVPTYLYFQQLKFDFNGQIADYVAWAKFKQLERDENRPWESLMESLQPTEQNIFE